MNELEFQQRFSSINTNYGIAPKTPAAPTTPAVNEEGFTFRELLEQQQQTQGVNFSKHAQERIQSRQIALTPQLMVQLSNAMESARAKGIKDALLVGQNQAFIVNVPTSTVITTLGSSDMQNHVFTNIDGAVIL